MSAVIGRRRAGRGFSRTPRPHLVEAGHRRDGAFGSGRALATMSAAAAVALFAAVLVRFRALGCLRRLAHPGNALPDQFLDRGNALAVSGRNDSDRGAASPGAPGAADAVDIIVGMVRDIEIEDMAHLQNVEAPRGDVGGDEQRHFVLAELIDRYGARALVHVAV